jgi:putative solute:sodium symporter small subunit
VAEAAPAADAARTQALARHWRASLGLTAALLALWFAVVFIVAVYARELSEFHVLGIPLSFYLFAQGAPLFFLALIGIHAWWMNRADRRFAQRHSATR